MKPNLVKCKLSASLSNNNLSASGSALAFAHKNEVYLLKNSHTLLTSEKSAASSQTTRCAYAEKDNVSQAKYCRLSGGDLLVISTINGSILAFDETGQKAMGTFKLTPKSTSTSAAVECHLRGLADDGKATVVCGTGAGDLAVLTAANKTLELAQMVSGHTDAVCCADWKDGVLATGDEGGRLILWDSSFQVAADFKGAGYPVTSVVVGHGLVAAGYATGHIRLFDSKKKELVAEIAAHTRIVTALQMHPSATLLASVSEDSFVTVWTLPTPSAPQGIKNVMATPLTTGLLTGVAFCGTSDTLIAVAAYDSRFISVLPRPAV